MQKQFGGALVWSIQAGKKSEMISEKLLLLPINLGRAISKQFEVCHYAAERLFTSANHSRL